MLTSPLIKVLSCLHCVWLQKHCIFHSAWHDHICYQCMHVAVRLSVKGISLTNWNAPTYYSLGCDNPDKWPSSSISPDKNHIKLQLPVPVWMLAYHGHLAKASLFPSRHFIVVCYLSCGAVMQWSSPVSLTRPLPSSVTQVSEWPSANETLFYEPRIIRSSRQDMHRMDNVIED